MGEGRVGGRVGAENWHLAHKNMVEMGLEVVVVDEEVDKKVDEEVDKEVDEEVDEEVNK